MDLLIFALLCYGITNILVFGSIFNGVRFVLQKYNPKFLGKLITCMMCTSFWVGVFVSFFMVSPIIVLFGAETALLGVIYYLFTGSLASGVVWLLHSVQEWFEK